MRFFRLVSAAALLTLLLPLAASAVPHVLGYEGRLLKDGEPWTGTQPMTFTLFDAESAGSSLWTEAQTLALTDGYYATFLGSTTEIPPALFDGSERYLEVAVGGEILSPRQRIASVGYAVHSEVATNVSGGSVNASSVAINGGVVIDANGKLAGTAAYLPGNGLEFSNGAFQLLGGCNSGQILKWSGSAWACAGDDNAGGTVTGVTATAPLVAGGSAGAPVLSMPPASGTASGFLNATDWVRFDAGQKLQGTPVAATPAAANQVLKFDGTQWAPAVDANSGGTVTGLTAQGPLSVATGSTTPVLTIAKATGTADGYLTSSDWTSFTQKLATGATASGDLTGTLPGPTVAKLQGNAVSASAPASGQVLKWNGSAWAPAADVDTNSGGTVTAVSALGPLGVATGSTTPVLTIAKATGAADGYLSATDWISFSQKLATGAAASGDLSGTLPGPTVAKLQGNAVSATAPAANQVLKWNGTAWAPSADVDTNSGGTVTGVSGVGPLSVATGSTTPVLTIAKASGTTDGFLSSADWTTFTAKLGPATAAGGDLLGTYGSLQVLSLQGNLLSASSPGTGQVLKWNGTAWTPAADANAGGTVTSVSAAGAPLTVTNGGADAVIGIAKATTSTGGYVSSDDWNTFNDKLGVSSPAGGDLTGGVTNSTIAKLQGKPVSAASPASGQVLQWNGTAWVPATPAVPVTAVSATAPLTVTGTTTPTIALPAATTSANGYLTSADWTTFNGKLGAASAAGGDLAGTLSNLQVARLQGNLLTVSGTLTAGQVLKWNGTSWAAGTDVSSGGTVTSVTGTSPISVIGTNAPVVTIQQANSAQPGYLASADWTSFNNKLSTGTAAGGDLSGTLPTPTVSAVQGRAVSASAPAIGQTLVWNGSAWAPAAGGFGTVPLGSIIAWHKNLPGTPALPDGWVECNGQVVSDALSPFNGTTLPNLNGETRFLRGGATSGALQNATQVAVTLETNAGAIFFDASGRNMTGYNTDADSAATLGSNQRGSIGRTGLDNAPGQIYAMRVRPVNMTVVWVMRIK